ncbi:uncharacterized protein [Amphiura filiformis]|uniref:uncharacterized protein n=1 Tax=Amphiura filiformis TaxID=82378 RepID=UPI003B225966
MAEARPASLASTIGRDLLECVICSDPFKDPRALPCLHPFCCECLEGWAKFCSDDNSIVSCSLCKKIYRIPEEGMKGFPAHFLVTNLQDTVHEAKQRKANTPYCENHDQEKRYFCENCACTACSDCGVLDPAHSGHSFIRLKEASRRLSNSLENLARRMGNIEERYTASIQQIQQVKQNLGRATDEQLQAIEEAKNEFMQQVDNLVEAYQQDVYRKKEENTKVIKQIEEKLQVHLTSLRNLNEQASNVIESGSDSDIILCYPSLSSSLQQLDESQPAAVDSKLGLLGQVELEQHQPNSVDLPTLDQLLCDKLHIPAAPTHITSHLLTRPAAAATKHLPSLTESQYIPSVPSNPVKSYSAAPHVNAATSSRQGHVKSPSKPKASQGPSFSLFSKFPSLPGFKSSTGKRWKECGQFKTAPHIQCPTGIAIHPNGDIAITSSSEPVTVFSRNGDFKHVIEGPPCFIQDIAITPTNQYIIPGKNEFHIYDSQCVLVNTIPTYDINNEPSFPSSVTVDSAGRIIVALCQKTVSIHHPNGTLISNFATPLSPCFVTCTPDDKLIISFEDNGLQVMDQSGQNASIILPPPGIQSWIPEYVFCSKQGELFVGNWGNPKAVYRYISIDGEYRNVPCIRMEKQPWGIALSADGKQLFVVDWRSNLVRVFQ